MQGVSRRLQNLPEAEVLANAPNCPRNAECDERHLIEDVDELGTWRGWPINAGEFPTTAAPREQGYFLPGGQDFSSTAILSFCAGPLQRSHFARSLNHVHLVCVQIDTVPDLSTRTAISATDKMASQERSMPFIKNLASSGPFDPTASTQMPSTLKL